MKKKLKFCLICCASVCLALTTILSGVLLLRTQAAEVPTLFYNDTVWTQDDAYPSIGLTVGNSADFWIPLSFFEMFDSVRVRRVYGNMREIYFFVINDEKRGKYLSFQVGNEYVKTERSTLLMMKTYAQGKEEYLPMRDICHYFGWSFEYTPDKKTVRITDGGEKETFSELLRPYFPEGVDPLHPDAGVQTQAVTESSEIVTEEPVKQTEPAVTEPISLPKTDEPVLPKTDEPPAPPKTDEPPAPEKTDELPAPEKTDEPPAPKKTDDPPRETYRSEQVVLTFEDIDGVNTPEILDILSDYGEKALFFVTGEQLSAHPELVTRMLSEGHAVGLHTMTDSEVGLADADTLLASFNEENDLLYALTKRKTRIVRLPEGSHSGVLHLGNPQKEALAAAGYVLWDWSIAAYDDHAAYRAEDVLEKIRHGMKNTYYSVIRFHCTETAVSVLPKVLRLVEEADGVYVRWVTEATTPVVFP